MIIGVDKDAMTPTDHAYRLYERPGHRSASSCSGTRPTTRRTTGTGRSVTPMIVEWFERHLVAANLDVREDTPSSSTQQFVEVQEEP